MVVGKLMGSTVLLFLMNLKVVHLEFLFQWDFFLFLILWAFVSYWVPLASNVVIRPWFSVSFALNCTASFFFRILSADVKIPEFHLSFREKQVQQGCRISNIRTECGTSNRYSSRRFEKSGFKLSESEFEEIRRFGRSTDARKLASSVNWNLSLVRFFGLF